MYRRLVLGTLFVSTALAQVEPPIYRAGRTLDAITIDGRIAEFTWAALPRVGRFTDIRQADQSTAAPTQATVAWDDRNLYVAFVCTDDHAWGTMHQRDCRLWEQEVVEVFLDPDGDGKNYPELEVSPHNVVVDLLIPAAGGGVGTAIQWDIEGLRTAVVKQAAGWTVEIAIPWASLSEAGTSTKPNVGDRWRVGLYRIERPGGVPLANKARALRQQIAAASGTRKKNLQDEVENLTAGRQWLAWSPTRVERGFHDPERFGVVEFSLGP